MALLGKVLRRIRAGERRSPLSGTGFDAPQSITVTSSALPDGGAMPASSAGKGVGDNISPPLRWTGLPSETRQIVLIIDDIDVPLPRPLLHTIAVIDPTLDGVAASSLQPGATGMRFIRADLGNRGTPGRARFPATGHTTTDFTSWRPTSPSRTTSPRPRICWPHWRDMSWPGAY
jgi:phosphatidylethanolamine-binding protein (PEBP) family uncharacterized protein